MPRRLRRATRVCRKDYSGKKDGPYRLASAAGDESPLGELTANATAEGYSAEECTPFHGSYCRILTRQGPNTKGAAIDYVVHDAMVGGFALVAYSVNSGVMTFVINHNGTLYQKDLANLAFGAPVSPKA